MMRPSVLLRTLSFRIPAKFSPSPVAPWPVRGALDQWLCAELDNLQFRHQWTESYTSATWVVQALDVAMATQKKTAELITAGAVVDRKLIDDHLDDAVELLDACNSLRERMETVMKYTESVSVAMHCLEGRRNPHESALSRSRVALGLCESMEKRWSELDKCGSSLRRLGEKLAQGVGLGACGGGGGARAPCSEMGPCPSELEEALSASKAMALLVCGVLSISLSFKSKRGLPATQSPKAGSWPSSLHELHKVVKEEVEKQRKSGGPVLDELRSTVAMARELRGLIQRAGDEVCWRELQCRMEAFGRKNKELQEGIKMFERRIDGLYKQLISIRMALMGVLTVACDSNSL